MGRLENLVIEENDTLNTSVDQIKSTIGKGQQLVLRNETTESGPLMPM